MNSKIALRTYCDDGKKRIYWKSSKSSLAKHKRILVFDTETSVDEYQNLKFGSFLVTENGRDDFRGIFYSKENVSENEEAELVEYCRNNPKLELYTQKEFVETIFFPEILDAKTLCIAFNLPFDISRLAMHYGEGRYNHRGWFSIKLSEDYPRIKIRHLDSSKSFIELGQDKRVNYKHKFKGHFLDLKTLSTTFTERKSITLRQAGESFGCEILKTEAEEHGIINKKYIEYNLNDVNATCNLYQKLKERYLFYGISLPITKIYSSASLGKQALKDMGIKSLSQINSEINSKIKGELMTSYFGGRCEARVRHEPVLATTLDFLSMYPSLTINMGLWDYIIAKEIKVKVVTEEIRNFLKGVKIGDLRQKEIWKGFNVLVELEPNEDILPIRSNYKKDSQIYNVGINYVKNKKSLFYALPDVISSMLLTGRVPKMLKAIRFIPYGIQESLRKINILGIEIDPQKDNFIKKLIEKRYEIKMKMKSFEKGTLEYSRLNEQQKSIKILANSSTYGIFIEMNQKDNESKFEVHGQESFWVNQKIEEEGKFFNPLIAVMEISGARLLLAMAESYIAQRGETHYYMDTDSCYVSPHLAIGLKNFFAPLNPYDFDADFFEIEKEGMLFYAISSKRYVLYKMENGKPVIKEHRDGDRDYKLHGLGHILNPYKTKIDWQKQIWIDILNLHYGNLSRQDIIDKYSQFYCISKLSVSTPEVYKRFKEYNKNKPFSKQIKPFNFFLIGQGTDKSIKPIIPYSKYPQISVFKPFINYKNGIVLRGEEYWRPLSEIILRFIDHPESKFVNGDKSGVMERRWMLDDEFTFIGKETRNLENQCLALTQISEYTDKDAVKKKILDMTPEEAREKGVIHRNGLTRLKERIRKGNKINWEKGNARKLAR